MAEAAEILQFWFGENAGEFRPIWFDPDDAFREAARRFQDDYQRAVDDELAH